MSKEESRNNDHKNSYHAFLESLRGKMVTIYRGGPESKTGILLDVNSDYVTLLAQNKNNKNNNQQNNQNEQNIQRAQDNQNTVVYYQAQHVKSISEDSKTNSMQIQQAMGEQPEFFKADDFTGVLKQLTNETIQINQGGPESKNGTLLGVNKDHLILYTQDDGIVYFNVHHVKSISKYQNNSQNSAQLQQAQITYPEYINASDFHDVFRNMTHKWVAINRGGPEAMEGVLVENSGGHYTLVSNQEVLRIHPYHIRSISSGPKGSLKQNNNEEDQSQQQTQETTVKNEESNEESQQSSTSNEKRSNKRSSREEKSTEKIVKTIDYVWKGRF